MNGLPSMLVVNELINTLVHYNYLLKKKPRKNTGL